LSHKKFSEDTAFVFTKKKIWFYPVTNAWWGLGKHSPYNNYLWAGRYGVRIPVGARFSAPIQASPGAHPFSCTVSNGSFFWGAAARVWQWLPTPICHWGYRKSRAIPVLSFWAFMAHCRVNFTFAFTNALKVCRDELCNLIQTEYL
jgi:hypothetical protein